ncbi:MAG: winged helix-turn-helix domain-containing protein [Lachnospiraceae bacterium]|nr:winged helix-turn-helix domain-containing protein [Lachnospiraceae bacterium]
MGRRSRLPREDEANGANPDDNGAYLNSDLAVRIISIIQEQPDISQSEIAEKIGIIPKNCTALDETGRTCYDTDVISE